MITTNNGAGGNLVCENCFHTYFNIGDIGSTVVTGLNGAEYLDMYDNFSRNTECTTPIEFSQETARMYLDSHSTVEIHDFELQRRIRIKKSGSLSTVLWNPWKTKGQQLPDFATEEYTRMLCVESGNIAENKITLGTNQSASMKIELSTLPLEGAVGQQVRHRLKHASEWAPTDWHWPSVGKRKPEELKSL